METKNQDQEQMKLNEGISVHEEQEDLEIEILDMNDVVPEHKAKKRSKEERAQFDRTTFLIITYSAIVVLFLGELVVGKSMLEIDFPLLAIVLLLNLGIGYLLSEASVFIPIILVILEVVAGLVMKDVKLTTLGAILLIATAMLRKLQKRKEM
ncbi:hypothetical protein [Anaerosacchariphilus polymeriproducens]|uniref:Uncharacterized protein n=1 Tax=Anaerosacchariphilus polymeriproducens TaxID=1812858 RepID=A0A371AUN6_9FIRM|nr:hypothetical protein [Anaerosacchariphilus polymeriproducens]RDU23285.1 hypothetical protein DWV06_10275 [Anaerosacchariphilus polymeriproducens]